MNNRSTEQPNRTPITRRSALGTALASLVAAGAASVLPAQAEAQPAEPTVVSKTVVLAPMLSKVVHTDDLMAESLRLAAERDERSLRSGELFRKLLASATPEQREWIFAWDTALTAYLLADNEVYFAEIARHLPGLYPTLRLLTEHVARFTENIGRCCTVDEGFQA